MRTYDLSHVPLFVLSIIPWALAVLVPLVRGGSGLINPRDSSDLAILTCVVALIALAAIIGVIGHERVGFAHIMKVVEQDDRNPAASTPRR